MRMGLGKSRLASSIIGIVTIMCALPKLADIVHRYLQHGTFDPAATLELIAVPVIYAMVAYAERRS